MTCLLTYDILKSNQSVFYSLMNYKLRLGYIEGWVLSMQIENEIEYATRKIIISNYQTGFYTGRFGQSRESNKGGFEKQ